MEYLVLVYHYENRKKEVDGSKEEVSHPSPPPWREYWLLGNSAPQCAKG
jgi:hypothetical protein